MANEIASMRTGLVTRLETISGLHVHKYADAPLSEFPAITIDLTGGPRRLAIGGNAFEADFRLGLYLIHGDVTEGWKELEKYCEQVGTFSILAALQGDETLAGAADYLLISEAEDIGLKTLNDEQAAYYGAAWTVHVGKSVA